MDVVTARTKSALADKLAAEGPVIGEYSCVETALRFADVRTEFAAITTGAGVYDLGWRGKIAVTGGDRARWLNGMVTNNIKDLAENHGNYNFLLNAQGRIQGDMYAYNRGERILLDTERSQVEHLMKTLEHFIIMDDVELADVSDQITAIGLQGPNSDKALKACGIEASCTEALVVCDVKWNGKDISVTRMANEGYLTYEIWMSPKDAPGLWDALRTAKATPVGTEALEKFRVMTGVPKYGTDIRERDLPQETEQKHALNFTKGCYIGQEIVERIRSRGNLHRTFTGFELSGPLTGATKITDANGKEVGDVTSVASIPINDGERWIGLGYIRREAAEGDGLKAGGVEVKAAKLPFRSS